MGLGLTNQHTMLIFEIPLALGVLVVGGQQVCVSVWLDVWEEQGKGGGGR